MLPPVWTWNLLGPSPRSSCHTPQCPLLHRRPIWAPLHWVGSTALGLCGWLWKQPSSDFPNLAFVRAKPCRQLAAHSFLQLGASWSVRRRYMCCKHGGQQWRSWTRPPLGLCRGRPVRWLGVVVGRNHCSLDLGMAAFQTAKKKKSKYSECWHWSPCQTPGCSHPQLRGRRKREGSLNRLLRGGLSSTWDRSSFWEPFSRLSGPPRRVRPFCYPRGFISVVTIVGSNRVEWSSS